MAAVTPLTSGDSLGQPTVDWPQVAWLLHLSRALDEIEESRLLPARQLFYQFSARGHDLAQILLGQLLTHPHDAVNGYYRSRPMMLTLGLDAEEALVEEMPLGVVMVRVVSGCWRVRLRGRGHRQDQHDAEGTAQARER